MMLAAIDESPSKTGWMSMMRDKSVVSERALPENPGNMTGTIVGIAMYNSTLMKTAPVWQENNVVVIQGRMSWRNGEPKMICDQAAELKA